MIDYSPVRPVLFLDIDGVLNAHEEIHPEVVSGVIRHDKVELLNFVLKHTNSQIVVSSAWRYLCFRDEMKTTGLSWLLRSHGIWNRLVSVTRADTMLAKVVPNMANPKELWAHFPTENERGQQISDWLTASGHAASYAVVDDLDLGIRAAGHPFVQTDGTKGLQAGNVVDLIRMLGIVGAA